MWLAPEGATPCAALPSLFDTDAPTDSPQVAMLRRLCATCPVQAECYLIATTTPTSELAGFMAGLTEGQRRHAVQKAVA